MRAGESKHLAQRVSSQLTAVLALDRSPAAEPLLECAAELPRWSMGRLLITHVVRFGYGQEPGDRALEDTRQWLERRAVRLRNPDLRVEVLVRAARPPSRAMPLRQALARAEWAVAQVDRVAINVAVAAISPAIETP